MIARRALLGLGGGAVTLAVLARAWDQGLIFDSNPGLQAWDDWNYGRHSGPLALVSAGILAASPHNSQPWRFGIGRYGVDIFEDRARSLGAMDPFGRERLAGLGAAIHNMGLAATAWDPDAVIRLAPDAGAPGHVARVEIASDARPARPHPLLAMVGRRHTDRSGWTGAAIATADRVATTAAGASPFLRVVLFDPAGAAGKMFAALTLDATAAIAADAEMMAASHAWFRHGRRDRDVRMDGLGLATSGVSPLLATAGAMLPDLSPASEGRYWLAATRDTALPTASLFGFILARDPHDRRTALLAGAAWQRLHLIAIARGLAAQPLNQLPEMIDRERHLGQPPRFGTAADALLPDPGWRPTFGFRLGHAARPAPASPRRPVSQVLGPPARLEYDLGRARAETAAQDAALARKLRGK